MKALGVARGVDDHRVFLQIFFYSFLDVDGIGDNNVHLVDRGLEQRLEAQVEGVVIQALSERQGSQPVVLEVV